MQVDAVCASGDLILGSGLRLECSAAGAAGATRFRTRRSLSGILLARRRAPLHGPASVAVTLVSDTHSWIQNKQAIA
jgi:hypothetical protein